MWKCRGTKSNHYVLFCVGTSFLHEKLYCYVPVNVVLINIYSAGSDFRRQNLTSKVGPRAEKKNIYNGRRPIT